MKNGADLLVDGLVRWGVRQLFGMPGSHSTAIYDAISREGSIRTTLIRNEQAGAFAADGYARVTGEPGVVCTTAGPGATNALTGVAECWADSVPILLLSGQVNSDALDRECGNYHEINLEDIFRPVTQWCGTVRRLDEIPRLVGRAMQAMTWGRPRPAALFLPQDLMRAGCSGPIEFPAFAPRSQPAVPAEAIARAAQVLAGAERPIIIAGGGALASGAGTAIESLARRLAAPVVTTLNGKGLLDERNPLSLGHVRSTRGRHALPHADAMLAVGCRFTEVMTDWRRMSFPETLVQIDLDPEQIGMNHPVVVGIVADATSALDALLSALPTARQRDGWGKLWELARASRPARPEWLIDALRATLPSDVPVFTDACEIGYRMQADWPAHGPRLFFYPSNYISLGWAYPAAIGAAVALGGGPVLSVSGDGGFVMTAQELATAVRYRLRVIAVVHNDSTYGAIKNIQKHAHGGRYLDVELNNPDFLQLAAAYGAAGQRVRSPDDLAVAVRTALDRDGPSLIEVPDEWRFLRDLATPVPKQAIMEG
jgi:thiamine pyrophosphate-dependent acetolactate synthase large subunit-like protein